MVQKRNTITQERLEQIFKEHDPIGLVSMGAPSDEYRPEAEQLARRINDFSNVGIMADYIHMVFADMFAPLRIPTEPFNKIAEQIWKEINADRV